MGVWSKLFRTLFRSATKSYKQAQRSPRTANPPPYSSQGASPQPTHSSPPQSPSLIKTVPSPGEKMMKENMAWLNERWTELQRQKDAGAELTGPTWFFDDVTERQMEKLGKLGVRLVSGRPSKGQASDLIGLFEEVEEENEEILRYFKIPLSSMNQSRARYEVSKLLADPQKKEQWENRPATSIQREFYRYFNLKLPKNLTAHQAEEYVKTYSDTVPEDQWDEWEAYETMYQEINEPEERESFEIKKVSLTMYRSAIEDLKKTGQKLTDMDTHVVVEKLLEKNPNLQRSE